MPKVMEVIGTTNNRFLIAMDSDTLGTLGRAVTGSSYVEIGNKMDLEPMLRELQKHRENAAGLEQVRRQLTAASINVEAAIEFAAKRAA